MDEQQLQQLAEELQNGSDQERRAAAYKLGKSKNPAAAAALIRAFSDMDESVRQNSLDGLRSLGTKEAMEFLSRHAPVLVPDKPNQTTAEVASTGRRFFNLAIDIFVYEILMIFAVWPIARLVFGDQFLSNFWLNWLMGVAVLYLYYFAFETTFQKTPAKFLTETRVVMADGSRPDAATVAKRSLWRLVPFDAISLYTGQDPNQNGTWWHDRKTSTRVARG